MLAWVSVLFSCVSFARSEHCSHLRMLSPLLSVCVLFCRYDGQGESIGASNPRVKHAGASNLDLSMLVPVTLI